jgi:hypothetical protein
LGQQVRNVLGHDTVLAGKNGGLLIIVLILRP